MTTDLESTLITQSQELDWQTSVETLAEPRRGLYELGFVTLWELQSQLATIVLLALVAFAPIIVTLGVMISWSLLATCVYFHGRQRGLPDLLETTWNRPPLAPGQWCGWAAKTGFSLVKAWLAGVQPFLYSRTFARILARPANCWRMRLAHGVVLSVALTLFGVTAAHHMLRKAGLPDRRVLQLSYVGSFLNVPYRILLSAIVVNAVLQLAPRISA
jgi:hypothetical protein